jgi:hypothetical protein
MGFFLTLVGVMPMLRKRLSTVAASAASISPDRSPPSLEAPVQTKTGSFFFF